VLKMEDYNRGLIYTAVEDCINCNKCIRECPILKSNVLITGENDQHKICVDDRECILCGTCMDTCVHDARRFKDDCDNFFADLQQGKDISVIVAPSFYLNYPTTYKNIFGYLRSIGVKNFYPVAFGGDITTWGYMNFLDKNQGGYISQPCPTIVAHIEKHHPNLLSSIIPVQSPMISTAIYLRKYKNIMGDFAFLSPCISKKLEAESVRGKGLVKYNVTFKRLAEHFEKHAISPQTFPEVEEDIEAGMGSLFPIIGGLKENIEYYLGREVPVMKIDGERKVCEFLKTFGEEKDSGKFMPYLIDIVNCENSCSQGTGTEFRQMQGNSLSYQSLLFRNNVYREHRGKNSLSPEMRRAALNEKFSNLNPNDFVCSYTQDINVCTTTVTEADINEVVTEKLHKLTENDQHVDCAACGYKSCRDMAEAIALGINHESNCMYYVKDELVKSMEKTSSAEAELRMFIYTMPVAIIVRDKDMNIVECNEETLRMFKVTDIEEYRDNYHLFWPETQPDGNNSAEKARRLQDEALKTSYARFGWQNQSADGEPMPAEITMLRLTWNGEYHVVSFIKDLRDEQKLKAAFKLTSEKLQAMLDASPILCAIYDENFKVIEANQAAANMFGLLDKNVYMERFEEVVPEFQPCGTPSLEKVKIVIADAFENGSSKFEWMHCTPDKQTMIPCEVNLECVTLGDKKVVVAFARDMREQKKLSETMKQLEESVEREQMANQAKTSFLARMSHEIRTPMNSILGLTELQLQKDNHPEDTEESFSRIYNSSILLLSIINDILDLSKVEAGKMEIIPATYEVLSMIVDTVQLNKMYIDGKRIEFVLDVDKDFPAFLIGDEIRIKQGLNNILSNAFKYTLEGSVKLSFTVEKGSNADEIIMVITVSDTGQGMSEDQLESLFDSEFSRFNMESNKYIEGSGLGLNIAHRLVVMMGGEIGVKSQPGKGTTFMLRIPQERNDNRVIGEEAAQSLHNFKDSQFSMKRVKKFEHEPMPYGRVLVVDDVESNLFVAKGFLQPYKLAIETVDSGILAVEKIKDGNIYDIIFMDHMMPDMDGIEATEIIRGLGYTKPIVALTANAFSDMAETFMSNGFSGYASKPIDSGRFDKILMEFIRDMHPPEVVEKARRAKSISEARRDRGISKILIASFIRDAKKAVKLLEGIDFENALSDGEVKDYIIQAHVMKSALNNVGRNELSNTARILEQAGRDKKFKKIKKELPDFLTAVHKVIAELKASDDEENAEQDMEFLREKMRIIADACVLFEPDDIQDANEAITELRKIKFSKQTKAVVDEIAELILNSDFEEAGELAEQALKL